MIVENNLESLENPLGHVSVAHPQVRTNHLGPDVGPEEDPDVLALHYLGLEVQDQVLFQSVQVADLAETLAEDLELAQLDPIQNTCHANGRRLIQTGDQEALVDGKNSSLPVLLDVQSFPKVSFDLDVVFVELQNLLHLPPFDPLDLLRVPIAQLGRVGFHERREQVGFEHETGDFLYRLEGFGFARDRKFALQNFPGQKVEQGAKVGEGIPEGLEDVVVHTVIGWS